MLSTDSLGRLFQHRTGVDETAPADYIRAVTILITGFAPWGTQRVNPSGEIAQALGGHVLPVEYGAAVRKLRRLLKRHRPRTLLMTGLASGRKRISLEAVALNVDHDDAPRRHRRWRRSIRAGGPLALAARLPLDALLQGLRKAGIPAAISHHAGTFVCNHLFYEALTAFPGPCGFVHVPPFKVLPASRQLKAMRTILRTLAGSSPAARR